MDACKVHLFVISFIRIGDIFPCKYCREKIQNFISSYSPLCPSFLLWWIGFLRQNIILLQSSLVSNLWQFFIFSILCVGVAIVSYFIQSISNSIHTYTLIHTQSKYISPHNTYAYLYIFSYRYFWRIVINVINQSWSWCSESSYVSLLCLTFM